MSTPSAEERFIDFLVSGKYNEMKELEGFLEQSKDHLHSIYKHSEDKRHEYEDLDMVVKFVTKPTYRVNHPMLIESLEDYLSETYLAKVLSLDHAKLKEDDLLFELQPSILKQTAYLRPAFNKKGKALINKKEYLFGGQSIEEMLLEYRFMKQQLETATQEYKQMMDDILPQVSKSIKTDYGTIVHVQNKPVYNMKKVLDIYESEWLRHYAKVDMSRLKEFISLGIVPKSILNEAATLEDIGLSFTVMSLSTEQMIFKIMDRKKQALSRRFIA